MFNAARRLSNGTKGQIHITQAENGFIIQIKFPFKEIQGLPVIPGAVAFEQPIDHPNNFDDFEFERPSPKVFVAKDYAEMFKILTENKLEDFNLPTTSEKK